MASPVALSPSLRALTRTLARRSHSQHNTSVLPTSRPLVPNHHSTRAPNDRRCISATSRRPAKQSAKPLGGKERDAVASFAATLRNTETFRGTTEPYVAYGATEELFKECARQCDYTIPAKLKKPPEPAPVNEAGEDVGEGAGWWFTPKEAGGLGLPITFNTWAQVAYLHMYALTVRMRRFPSAHVRDWEQNLLDHFFYAAEDRMATWHGMSVRSVRNKNLKDLWLQWRGVLVSYDEGLIKGDAMLATAVWRNVFQAKETADIADVAAVTAYLRRQLVRVDKANEGDITSGGFKFADAVGDGKTLDGRSPWLGKAFTKEDLALLEAKPAQ